MFQCNIPLRLRKKGNFIRKIRLSLSNHFIIINLNVCFLVTLGQFTITTTGEETEIAGGERVGEEHVHTLTHEHTSQDP